MKEKKFFAMIILAVSVVSLITALVAGLAYGLCLLIDMYWVSTIGGYKKFCTVAGALLIVTVALGIAFILTYFLNKKNRLVVNCSLCGAFVAVALVGIIVSRVVVHSNTYGNEISYSSSDYTQFLECMSAFLTMAVAAILITASGTAVSYMKKKEADAQVSASGSSEGVEQPRAEQSQTQSDGGESADNLKL